MNESILRSLLEESVKREWSKYDSVPEHVFSNKHNRAMKRIFKLYEKNTIQLRSSSISGVKLRIRFTRKSILTAFIIVLLALLAGCAAAYFISQRFHGFVHSDNTEIFPINTENCPTVIEEKYYLSELPKGFEILDTNSSPLSEYIYYKNKSTGQTVTFRQNVKPDYGPVHLNTERYEIEEVEINGHCGLCIDFSDSEYNGSLAIWDNGKYILELSTDLSKKELLDLAKSAKVCEN